MASRSRSSINIGSQEIVAFSSRSLLEQQSHSDKVRSTSPDSTTRINATETASGRVTSTSIVKSLMPAGLVLNARGTGAIIDGLRDDVEDANAENVTTRPRQEIPTADLVVRNSFKVGAKLLIKIERTKKTTKIPDKEPQLIFDKFSLQAIAESDAERYQLQETFEDEVLYLFGRRPRVWTMQGIVLNGQRAPDPTPEEYSAFTSQQRSDQLREDRLKKDMDWANRLLMNWENYYRGSKSVEARTRTFMAYDDSVVEATLLELVMARNAQVPTSVNATLTFVVHQRSFMGQEYIEGISPANLKDLIEKTNSGIPFEDKILASDIEDADLELAEVNRQQLEAEEQLRQKQARAQEKLEEENRIRDSISQAQSDRSAALSRSTEAEKRRQEAELDALDPTKTAEQQAEAEREAAIAAAERDQATKEALAAWAREQELQAALDPDATNEAVEEEESAKVKNDTLSGLAEQMDPVADQLEVEEDIVEIFSGQYDGIQNVQYDEIAGTVTFVADNPDGDGTVTITYDVNTGALVTG